jgi:hypothetical protein
VIFGHHSNPHAYFTVCIQPLVSLGIAGIADIYYDIENCHIEKLKITNNETRIPIY